MKIGAAIITLGLAMFLGTMARAAVDPTLPNIVAMFPDRAGLTADNNFGVTNRLGGPTLEWEILTVNIGGADWYRPPINRGVACTSPRQYYRMPQTHEYRVYWYDPDLGDYVQIDSRRKQTICIWDYGTQDHQFACMQQHARNFNCQCPDPSDPLRLGNGVSLGWADSYYRGLTGQWASLGSYTGSFRLEVEFDPDSLLQADDLLDREKDATHDDNISYVYFDWDGTGVPCTPGPTCVSNVQVAYTFTPVCG